MSKSGDVWRTHPRAYDDCITGYLPNSAAATYLIRRLMKSDKQTGIVVDAGCGHGSDTITLLRAGLTVVSLDVLERDIVQRVQDEVGTTDEWRFMQADLTERIPLSAHSVRAVLDVAVLPRIARDGNLQEAERYLREVCRVLEVDGLYVLEYNEPLLRLKDLIGWFFTLIEEQEGLRNISNYIRDEHKDQVPDRLKSIVNVWRPLANR